MPHAAILRIAYHLPENEVTNANLAKDFEDWDADKIFDKTGIAARRIAGGGEVASDLAFEAAENLFRAAPELRGKVDFLLYCTQSPDFFLPATACILQDRLKLRTSTGALDVNQGCSGFVYGLALANGLIESGAARNVLLLTADTYSKYLNRRDRGVRTVFGDGAAATLIGAVGGDNASLGPFIFGTDGSGAANLIVATGAGRKPRSSATAIESEDKSGNWRSEDNLFMNGPEIFNFTLKSVPPLVEALLSKAGTRYEGVDLFVFHQANRFMLDRLRQKIGIPSEKFVLELEDCGNTVSSTIPIAMQRVAARGELRAGMSLMLVGFGVGYSWAGVMMRVHPEFGAGNGTE